MIGFVAGLYCGVVAGLVVASLCSHVRIADEDRALSKARAKMGATPDSDVIDLAAYAEAGARRHRT